MLKKLFPKTYINWHEDGRKLGYKQGHEDAYKDAYKDAFENGYNKCIDDIETIEKVKDKTFKTETQQSSQMQTDEIMLWLKSLVEIMNTRFFSSIYFERSTSESVREVIVYIDGVEHTYETKLYYPETHYYLPELKKAFTKIYNNKLVIEEAERSIRK